MLSAPSFPVESLQREAWLLEALQFGTLDGYLQRMVDSTGQIVGHEAFARLETTDDGVIGGGEIMRAARALHMEHAVDQRLQRNAVTCFARARLPGLLCVNVLPDNTCAPPLYFALLDEAVTTAGLRPCQIVLDISMPAVPYPTPYLAALATYCLQRGYQLAMGKFTNLEMASLTLAAAKPAFIRLCSTTGEHLPATRRQETLRGLVALAHQYGAQVIASDIETQAQHRRYRELGADIYQGYCFGAPQRVTAISAQPSLRPDGF